MGLKTAFSLGAHARANITYNFKCTPRCNSPHILLGLRNRQRIWHPFSLPFWNFCNRHSSNIDIPNMCRVGESVCDLGEEYWNIQWFVAVSISKKNRKWIKERANSPLHDSMEANAYLMVDALMGTRRCELKTSKWGSSHGLKYVWNCI